jgi:choline dehydrogenase-like flavoprotein
MHPFSRGSVHIKSSSPFEKPSVDPRYLSAPVDLDLHVLSMKYIRKLNTTTEPLASVTRACIKPDLSWDAKTSGTTTGQMDEQEAIKEWVRNGLQSMWHPVGTASMLRKEEGGVVDEKLIVYGTKNLRVVDASILPLVSHYWEKKTDLKRVYSLHDA